MTSYVPAFPLYTYLNLASNHFSLKISLNSEDPAVLEKTPFPFFMILDSDPLTRLHEAHLVTDAGSEVKRVFLLVQRDQYLIKKDELWPIHNPDVDEYWQRAFSFYEVEKHNGSLTLLANQILEKRLVPFQPLFFCKTRKLFFGPPCPICGLPLEQCYDENLLARAGLQPYAASLKRYLFCPACNPQEGLHFYAYELDHSDPPTLKDRWGLIQEFGKLGEKENLTTPFPCIQCSLHQECYGADRRVLSRVVPFAFYPFYMLIFEAPSLNASDFLSLLSGATFTDLEAQLKTRGELGRIHYLRALNPNGLTKPPTLYPEDERSFLEILYLKLSFLGELIKSFLGEREIPKHPDIRLSLDRVWIQLEEPSGLLPFFWNFKVKFIDLYRSPGESLPRVPGFESLFFLGLVWFYTLLVNQKQNMAQVSLPLKEALNRFSSEADFSWNKFSQENSDSTLLPENAFWNPEGKKVHQNWHSLWEKSLHLGWQLLEACGQKAPEWSKEEFLKQLETLGGEARNLLFAAEPLRASAPLLSENQAVQAILLRIIRKWRKELEGAKEALEETTILSAGEVQKRIPFPPFPAQTADEIVSETVILSKEKVTGKSQMVEETVPETVIFSPGQATQKPSRSPGPMKRGDIDLRGKGQPPKETEKSGAIPEAGAEPEDDFLSETVILSPDKLREIKKKAR